MCRMTTITPTPHAPNSRHRHAIREAEAHARAEKFKAENNRLKTLIRQHHRAVTDGVGNWGATETALFKAVGR